MSDTGGGFASATVDGFTVDSNTETSEQIKENLESEPAPKDGEAKSEEEVEAERVKKAASELGKRGGKAAAEAREKAGEEEKGEGEAEEEKPEEKPHKKHDARARIEQLARERAEARRLAEEADRERKELRERLARLEAERGVKSEGVAEPGKPRAETTGSTGDERPHLKPEDHDTYEAGVEAYVTSAIQHEIQKTLERLATEAQQRQVIDQHVQRLTQTVDGFAGHINKALEADPEALNRIDARLLQLQPTFNLPPGQPPGPLNDIAQAIVESDQAVPLMLYLSEHEEEIERMTKLPDSYSVLRAMGALEARLSGQTQPAAPTRPVVSQAKPPVKPVTGSAQVTDELDDDTDFDTYYRVMQARERRQGRR